MFLVYLHFQNILLHMKKYIIPLPLVLLTFFFVWKSQEVETTTESIQTETSISLDNPMPEQETVSRIDDHLQTSDSEAVETTESKITNNEVAKDVRVSPSQAPPTSASKPRVIEILEKVKIATKESVIKTSQENEAFDTRISLVETSMKYPLMIVEEKGINFGQAEEEVASANAFVATHFMLQVLPGTNLVELEEKLAAFTKQTSAADFYNQDFLETEPVLKELAETLQALDTATERWIELEEMLG